MSSKEFQEFSKSMHSMTEQKLEKWWDILTSVVGTNIESTHEWNNIFNNQVSEIYDGMIGEMIEKRDILLNNIEELLQRASSLCNDLNIELPVYGKKCMTLSEEQQFLINQIQEYEKEFKSREHEIMQLNKREVLLCTCLGYEPKPLKTHPLSSEETISKFKFYLEQLESKKFEREEIFFTNKAEIVQLVKALRYEPKLEFERIVVSTNDSLSLLTESNMEQLRIFLESLTEQFKDTNDKIIVLRERLESLWNLLNEDLLIRDCFLKKHVGNNTDTLTALQEEVQRCEALKKMNIEIFVKRLRKELESLWDKCHMTDTDRRQFLYFNSDTYSEDLLSIHDLEITKMKDYYRANSDLFKLLEKRSELWTRMVELGDSALRPERYKNRGGQLLKEEKERNALAKRLPKIEEQLIHLADNFEAKHGKQFYSWGKTVNEIMQEDHTVLEETRKLKSSARKQKREPTPSKSTMMSSVSTQNLASLTPISGVKRKLLTPLLNLPKTAPAKVRAAPNRYSLEKSKRIEKCRRIAQRKFEKENAESEYNNFEEHLASREGCRSTLFTSDGRISKKQRVNTPIKGEGDPLKAVDTNLDLKF